MNNSIPVFDLKDGQIAITTEWTPYINSGKIVQNVDGKLITLGQNMEESFPGVFATKNPKLKVRVLKPGTTLKLTDKGLIIESELTPLFISEDEVEMYPAMRCYPYNTITETSGNEYDGCNVTDLAEYAYPGNNSGWLIFSTRQARDQYVDKHKIHLTTDDGVYIRKGDTYWFVDRKTFRMDSGEETGYITHTPHQYAYFSTQEKADDYVLRNKICLVTQDGAKLKKGDTYYRVNRKTCLIFELSCSGFADYDHLKFAFFSTKEKAQEYVNSKQTFNLEDLNEFLKQDNNISQDTINKFKEYLNNK